MRESRAIISRTDDIGFHMLLLLEFMAPTTVLI